MSTSAHFSFTLIAEWCQQSCGRVSDMAVGRNHVVHPWKTIGLLFIITYLNYSAVKGDSVYWFYESYTTVYVEAERGQTGFIVCKINASFDVVYWKRLADPHDYDLVRLDVSVTPPVRSGQGYEAGLFNITDDFSLVINDVKRTDDDIYYCYMRDYVNDILYENSTRFFVYSQGTPQRSASDKLYKGNNESTPATMYGPDVQRTHQRSTSENLAPENTTKYTPKALYAPDTHRRTMVKSNALSAQTTPTTKCPTDDLSTAALSTETTPTTECPLDLVFKVLSGISVGALAISWILIPFCFLSKKRRLAVND